MKRAILLSIVFAFLFLPKSDAQQWSFVTSFGATQNWAMPVQVVHAIEHDYWGYDIVHTRRIVQRGKLFFDVVLQRGDVFVNVSIGRYGRIYNQVVTYDYPFSNHICNSFCGYHSNFYRRNVVVCNSHHHHGHNHVTYVRRNYNHHPGNGNAYGHSNSPKKYRDTNSYKSRENSREYQSRSSNRYTVSNDRDAYKNRIQSSRESRSSVETSSSSRSRSDVDTDRSSGARSSVSTGNRAKTSSSSSSRSGRSTSSRSN